MAWILSRPISLPQYEFFVLATAYAASFGVFVLAMVLVVLSPIGLSSSEPQLEYIRRASRLLRLSASFAVVLTLPM